jgi:hypothetical protein
VILIKPLNKIEIQYKTMMDILSISLFICLLSPILSTSIKLCREKQFINCTEQISQYNRCEYIEGDLYGNVSSVKLGNASKCEIYQLQDCKHTSKLECIDKDGIAELTNTKIISFKCWNIHTCQSKITENIITSTTDKQVTVINTNAPTTNEPAIENNKSQSNHQDWETWKFALTILGGIIGLIGLIIAIWRCIHSGDIFPYWQRLIRGYNIQP